MTVVEPRGQAATAFVDGQHFVVLSFTFAGPEGTFSKTFGEKTGLATTTITCTVVEPEGTFTAVVAPVPPQG